MYLSYHRPAGEDAGETMLARGRWEDGALVDVRDIFASGATGTEGSRIGFAADGMLHMTVSAPGVGPGRRALAGSQGLRRQDASGCATTAASRPTTRS